MKFMALPKTQVLKKMLSFLEATKMYIVWPFHINLLMVL